MRKKFAFYSAIFVALHAAASLALADITTIFDPPGLGEIDAEIGNISQANLEGLGVLVEDHENRPGGGGPNQPFTVGGVDVSGQFGDLVVCDSPPLSDTGGHKSYAATAGACSAS